MSSAKTERVSEKRIRDSPSCRVGWVCHTSTWRTREEAIVQMYFGREHAACTLGKWHTEHCDEKKKKTFKNVT
jgi:hypothetical protein